MRIYKINSIRTKLKLCYFFSFIFIGNFNVFFIAEAGVDVADALWFQSGGVYIVVFVI